MATKLKKRRPALVMVVFVLAMSVFMVAASLLGYGILHSGMVRLNYQDTAEYKNSFGLLIGDAWRLATESNTKEPAYFLGDEGENISYAILANDRMWENVVGEESVSGYLTGEKSFPAMTGGSQSASFLPNYDHLLLIKNGQVSEYRYHDIKGTASVASYPLRNLPYAGDWRNAEQQSNLLPEKPVICIAVRSAGELRNYGSIYSAYYDWFRSTAICIALATVGVVALLVILGTLFCHKTLGKAHRVLAGVMGRLWMEGKLVSGAAALIGAILTAISTLDGTVDYIIGTLIFLGCFWWCWVVLTDLAVNGTAFFKNNIAMSVLRGMRGLESRYAFLGRMKTRLAVLLFAEIVLAGVFMLCFVLFDSPFNIVGGMLAALLGIFLLVHYVMQYNHNMDDFARVTDYVAGIRNGTVEGPLTLEGDFSELAVELSDIMSGISRAVEEQTRSQKMKVELITNVSHDLKTPLTSIINYVDLLGRETLQPEYANDYVRVIEQKAQRLSHLVQDLFDVAKANSGEIDLEPEHIDVRALVEQTIAEMDEKMNQAGVEIKTQFSTQHLLVWADGRKLHRVFENLLGNALKYSLTGTRVYITEREIEGAAEISFKNVSGYEMTFTAEDIVERFQRGDVSRAGEGSGLGLAIAKSFAELSGGTLRIELDGDLFKAIVNLPLCPKAPEPVAEPVPEPEAEIPANENEMEPV